MKHGLSYRREELSDLPVLCWRFDTPLRLIASSPLGGGIGLRDWAINATVPADYDRCDPVDHLGEIASGLGLRGNGVGMLTAVDVTARECTFEDGIDLVATVGIGFPQWAAATAGSESDDDSVLAPSTHTVGTINVVAFIPETLSDAALVNAVATVTEAKAQAVRDRRAVDLSSHPPTT